jgi:hypothetical protein
MIGPPRGDSGAEEAKVHAIRAQIDAVIERDVWPKELYWDGI